MTRKGFFILTALAAVAAGCARPDSGPPGAEASRPDALPVHTPSSGGTMVLVPAGTFTMGDAGGRPDETPHAVPVSAFYLDTVPVTQELYEKVMGVNPSKRKD